MDDVVNLSAASLLGNDRFIEDMARFSSGNLSEKQIRKKYRFTDDVWAALGSDEALYEAIDAEKTRRIRTGATKRERAQLLVADAPKVLGEIMRSPTASPKHVIDAAKTLDAFSATGPQASPADVNRFIIRIDLSGGSDDVGEVLTFDKSRTVNPPNVIENRDEDNEPA